MSIHKHGKDGKQWRVRIKCNATGKTHSRVLDRGTSKTQAKALEVEFHQSMNAKPDPNAIPSILKLVEDWLSGHVQTLVKPKGYESHARQILPFIIDQKFENIVDVAENIIQDGIERGHKPSTINHRTNVLRYIASKCADNPKYNTINYSRRIRKLKLKKGRELYLTEGELWDIYEHVLEENTEVAELMVFAAFTGVRKTELRALTRHSFSTRLNKKTGLEETRMVVKETKEGTPRSATLSYFAEQAYLNMQEGFKIKLGDTGIYGPFKRGLKKSNAVKNRPELLDFQWHDLRHTFASFLAQGGASLIAIQYAMGHKTMQSTQRYSHLCEDNYQQNIDILDKNKNKNLRQRAKMKLITD